MTSTPLFMNHKGQIHNWFSGSGLASTLVAPSQCRGRRRNSTFRTEEEKFRKIIEFSDDFGYCQFTSQRNKTTFNYVN